LSQFPISHPNHENLAEISFAVFSSIAHSIANMQRTIISLVVLSLIAYSHQQIRTGNCPKPATQPNFDASRYVGLWYEVARTPTPFEIGLKCITAEYGLLPNGSVSVLNSGRKTNGDISQTAGIANVPNPEEPAKLEVNFPQSPTPGPYWVLETDYTGYSVVFSCTNLGSIGRSQDAFVLSRTPSISSSLLNRILRDLTELGFNRNAFITNQQRGCDN